VDDLLVDGGAEASWKAVETLERRRGPGMTRMKDSRRRVQLFGGHAGRHEVAHHVRTPPRSVPPGPSSRASRGDFER
jgi:hypothetical protein